VRDHFALVPAGDAYREVDLFKSLLEFHVQSPDGTRLVRTGIGGGDR